MLRTVDMPATLSPPGPSQDRAPDGDTTAVQPGTRVRTRLLRDAVRAGTDPWYQPREESCLPVNPDLMLVGQVIALTALTAVGGARGLG
jgi:hypothetical protein